MMSLQDSIMATKAPYYYSELMAGKENTGEKSKSPSIEEEPESEDGGGFFNPLLSIEPDTTTGEVDPKCHTAAAYHQKKKIGSPHQRSFSLLPNGKYFYRKKGSHSAGDIGRGLKSSTKSRRRRKSESSMYEEIPSFLFGREPIYGEQPPPPVQRRKPGLPCPGTQASGKPQEDVLDEVAKVQKRHAQILENLNLDVETMIMPDAQASRNAERDGSDSGNVSGSRTSQYACGELSDANDTSPIRLLPHPYYVDKQGTLRWGANEYVVQTPGSGVPMSQSTQQLYHGYKTVPVMTDPSAGAIPGSEPLYMLYDDSHRQQALHRGAELLPAVDSGEGCSDDNIYEEVDLQSNCKAGYGSEDSRSLASSEPVGHSGSGSEDGSTSFAARIIGKQKKTRKKKGKDKDTESITGGFTRWFSTRRKEYDLEKIGEKMVQKSLTEDEGYVDVKIPKKQRPPLSLPPMPPGLTPEQIKRRYIVGSLVDSENSYVNSLQRLIKDYKRALEDSSQPIISQSKINTMFYRLEQILQCHTIFGIALTQCVREWDQQEKIGDVFVASFSKSMVLDIYSDFINNFSLAMETAKQASKNKSAFADFLKVKQITSPDRLSFFGLMVKPVQRFPQFILLLQDLLKHTPPGHHDRMSLQMALTQLESLAETLNERKRESEQHHAVREVLKHLGNKFSLKGATEKDHYLLRQDDVLQLEVDTSGLVVKAKERRLFLLNDLLICVTVSPRSSDDNQKDKYSLKWAVPLQEVDVEEDIMPATRNLLASSSRLRHTGSRKVEKITEANTSVQNLYNELSDLVHDLEVMSRITSLVSTLRYSYNGLNLGIVQKLSQSIQETIRMKDEEITLLDSCCLQFAVPTKSSKSSKELVCFQMASPGVKREWITELRLAKLALDVNNNPAWDIPEQETVPSSKMPLFVKTLPVFPAACKTEVKCGCYYTVSPASGSVHQGQHVIWLCSSDGANSHISVLAFHLADFRQISTFDLADAIVTTVEAAPPSHLASSHQVPMPSSSGAGGPPVCDTVWLGFENCKIVVLVASSPEKWKEVGTVTVSAPVSQICYHCDHVFVAFTVGTVSVFSRNTDGTWQLQCPQLVTLSDDPVTCLLPVGPVIYCASGRKVWQLNAITVETERSFSIQHEHEEHAFLLAQSGTGLWISLQNSATVCLYHTETFRHLQDINIASIINQFLAGKGRLHQERSSCGVCVTSLLASRGLLWVGTNVGIILTIPLPRLEGVPIISGRTNISYHAHTGPVSLLLSLHPVVNVPVTCRPSDESLKEPDDQQKVLNSAGSSDTDSPKKRQTIDALPASRSKTSGFAFGHSELHMSGAKTLPRNMHFHHTRVHDHAFVQDTNDVYGLYADLMNVQNYDHDSQEHLYERLNRSDPELIQIHLMTLNRRLHEKAGRPRSWDLSTMAVSEDSDSSAAYDSASTNTSHSTPNDTVSPADPRHPVATTPPASEDNGTAANTPTNTATCACSSATTTSTSVSSCTQADEPQVWIMHRKSSKSSIKSYSSLARQFPRDATQKTVLMLTGGSGYVYWKRDGSHHKADKHRERYLPSPHSHIMLWEMKL